jgi:hypothetical protein
LFLSLCKWYKSCPATCHGGTWGERKYSCYSFSTSTLDGGEWSAPRLGRAVCGILSLFLCLPLLFLFRSLPFSVSSPKCATFILTAGACRQLPAAVFNRAYQQALPFITNEASCHQLSR